MAAAAALVDAASAGPGRHVTFGHLPVEAVPCNAQEADSSSESEEEGAPDAPPSRDLSGTDLLLAERLRGLARDMDAVRAASEAAEQLGARARAILGSRAAELAWALLPLLYGFRAPRAFFFVYTFVKDGARPVAQGFAGIAASFELALGEVEKEVALCDALHRHLVSRERCQSIVAPEALPRASPKELWKTAALRTVKRGASSELIIGGLSKPETLAQLERLFARTTRVSLLQRFLDPEELISIAKGLHKGVLGSLYRSLSWGASLAFGDSSMAAVVDAFSVGHFLRGLLVRELRRLVAWRRGAAEWSSWQTKWADFWISATTTVFSAAAAYRLFAYEHIIGTSLLGATALTAALRRLRARAGGEPLSAPISETERLRAFYWQLLIAAGGAVAQLRLQRFCSAADVTDVAKHAAGRRARLLRLFLAVADRALAPLLLLERVMTRHTGMIYSLNFNM